MNLRIALAITILSSPLLAGAAPPRPDVTGCKDHPLFTRIPDSWIGSCVEKEFDAYEFPNGKTKTNVEGHFWRINYYPQEGSTKTSELQIIRNFENAAKRIGGTVLFAEKTRETFLIKQGGKEFWVLVWAEFTGKHGLYIVQKQEMQQDVVANAAVFSDDLRNTGHAAVYGILFDTGKADIRPESAQAIGEIAKLLKGDPALKLFVVGHTDNVGGIDSNLKLSDQRASAVMQALVHDHGITPARLRAFGAGQFAPVAPNDDEDGRKRNRRVELVRQ